MAMKCGGNGASASIGFLLGRSNRSARAWSIICPSPGPIDRITADRHTQPACGMNTQLMGGGLFPA